MSYDSAQVFLKVALMGYAIFADFDWPQAFFGSLMAGGGVLVITAAVFFVRAMTATRETSSQFDSAQPVHLASLALGIALILGGLYFRGSLSQSPSSTAGSFSEYTSKEGRFKVSFPGTPKEQTQNAMGLKIKMFLVEEKDGVFGVAYLDMPGSGSVKNMQPDAVLTNARNYLVNDRAYQVLILGKRSWLDSDKARKFLNSFAVK
jgi:hypothetical protein